ncbi:redox-sensitive transcriptional activator SoxR [Pectobacterium polaris]|uniref:redox-sensitive transcriptional activator SoxR n=1 Tax=Pectobacterium polaris TaxID=2042057 RepID=UPI00202D6962|nr:redox-sensitive transcriptional activator SoxR [Pectobacterium polaris]MCL6325737.1 redox-sensitive transcriptional activator SoxR [Pectobacterium polaris]
MKEKINDAQNLSVGEVAKRSGLPISTLHFYESKGLLKAQRTAGNQRVFSRGVLRRIAIIRIAQSSGVSLAEIKDALESIPHDRKASAKEWETVSKTWALSLKQRIAQLTHLSESLEGCIGCGCLTMGECPLLNPADALGDANSGPVLFERYLHEKSLLS